MDSKNGIHAPQVDESGLKFSDKIEEKLNPLEQWPLSHFFHL